MGRPPSLCLTFHFHLVIFIANVTGVTGNWIATGHARRRLKLIRIGIAHAHARTHATSAMSRLEAKKKDHAAKVQQRNVRSSQPAPPGPVLARASAIGARSMTKDPKIRSPSLSRESWTRHGHSLIRRATWNLT
jgi:hypothetical protein